MALSFYQINRWYKMLTGKSVWHVNQNIGMYFSKDEIRGYYNDLEEKVTRMPELLDSEELPRLDLENGQYTYFPVAVFQYGLGAYDLYLSTSNELYENKFMQSVNWTVDHQDEQGRWNNFAHCSPEAPYGAMAQGEGASLLIRAYKHTNNRFYLECANRAIDFMLMSLEQGGTTKYVNHDAYLMEYTNKEMVLNGSIFAWWGLYDYVLCTNDEGRYKQIRDNILQSLIRILPSFKFSYWSKYSLDGLIASPFYHNVHIAQMRAMFELTGDHIFNDYAAIWLKQQKNPLCKSVAFIKKAIQKILEKD